VSDSAGAAAFDAAAMAPAAGGEATSTTVAAATGAEAVASTTTLATADAAAAASSTGAAAGDLDAELSKAFDAAAMAAADGASTTTAGAASDVAAAFAFDAAAMAPAASSSEAASTPAPSAAPSGEAAAATTTSVVPVVDAPTLPPGVVVSPVRGVPRDMQAHYQGFKHAVSFTCFDGSATLASFDAVNDDYCDCRDGSDEPGTGACSHLAKPSAKMAAKFSCSWNITENLTASDARLRQLSLSAVNDGICDCCGGEDEYNGEVVCRDTCAEAAAEESLHEKERLEGSKAREAYVEQAKGLKGSEQLKDVDGGPDDAFLAAAAAPCVNFDDGDYKYEVCLFSKVTQKNLKSGESTKIGGKGEWATSLWESGQQRKDYTKLIQGGGDQCFAASAPRKAEVLFECGKDPQVLSIQETQVCVYTVKMKTPAACHPLVHK